MAKKIPLQNGMFAIVDDEDYERANQFNWHLNRNVAYTKITEDGVDLNISLSEFIYKKVNKNNIILWKNLNSLDYRKENLAEVNLNNKFYISGPSSSNTSGYKGVSWDKQNSKWNAYITLGGSRINLGLFNKKEEAVRTYNEAVKRYFGRFGFLNVIGEDNRKSSTPNTSKQRKRPKKEHSTNYRGISLNRKTGRCRVVIHNEGNQIYVGSFYNEEQAAKAYDKKAYEIHGDKAILNFPDSI